MLRVIFMLGLVAATSAITCMVGNPTYSYSKACTVDIAESLGAVPTTRDIQCCKKITQGPWEAYDCASRFDDCEERSYDLDDEQGYEDGKVYICAAADCNPASLPTTLTSLILLPIAFVALYHLA